MSLHRINLEKIHLFPSDISTHFSQTHYYLQPCSEAACDVIGEGRASFGWLWGGAEGYGNHFEGLWRERGEGDVSPVSFAGHQWMETLRDQGVIPFAFNNKAIYILESRSFSGH